jgi:hypothetical protein
MRVTVADVRATDHDGVKHRAGQTLDVEDPLAQKWLERQLVMPTKLPAKKATKIS